MENHPIPQDITGFQFKLIGNMTIRQFVYLAIGAILAWLFFFMFGLPAIIKWPLAIFSLGAGAIFAFVPIDGRPMDTMLSNFIKAIISPTEFIYQKEGMKVENDNLPKSQPLHLPHLHKPKHHDDTPITGFQPQPAQQPNLAQMQVAPPVPAPIQAQASTPVVQSNPAPVIEITPPAPIQPVQAPIQAPPATMQNDAPMPPPPPPPMPTNIGPITATMTMETMGDQQDLRMKNRELDDLKDDNKKLSEELERLKKELEDAKKAKEEALNVQPVQQPIVQAAPEPTPEQKELQRQLIEAERQRAALQQQILQQQSKAETPTQGVTPTVTAEPVSSQRVRSIAPGMERAAGIPSIPEAPNLITGIVKDPRGNPLQNILIEVKDQDSNPVRAFKTNGLGKFASATSLSNGKYLITFEDPKETNKFDAVEIELIGTPVMPLEIISVDPREELRRELFK